MDTLITPPPAKPLTWNIRPVVLGIYQVNWFSSEDTDHVKVLQHLYRIPDDWNKMVAMTTSGKRLKEAFKARFDQILWRITNPGPHSRDDAYDYDMKHIRDLFMSFRPDYVITFGQSATQAVNEYLMSFPYTGGLHSTDHPVNESSATALATAAFWLNQKLRS